MPSFLNTLFRKKNAALSLNVQYVANLGDYQKHLKNSVTTHQARWHKELALAATGEPFTTVGYCYPCQKEVEFQTDFLYSHTTVNGKAIPNWRERVLCPCQMNNRTRASIQILEETLSATKRSRLYLAEQVTPLYNKLKTRFPTLVGSEYLGDKIPFGSADHRGVRNESITKLTFEANSFDYILNFDVLEHVPDVDSALKEIHRVLKPRGTLLLSVPFLPGEDKTHIRAKIGADGNIVHLAEPQYHGDPIDNAGCLCFQDFGWELLDQMRAIGFNDVNMLLYWSEALGYYGVEQMMIVAKKK
jgi:SAM-dependent methyltransferase